MSESSKWKSKLLSSSAPMEYEVSKLLVNKGFSIHADYSYTRFDAKTAADFSVDLHASIYVPFRRANEIKASLEILVECKYRQRGNKWLFFSDPNQDEMSPFTLGHTLRVVDDFSPILLKSDYSTAFDKKSTFCLKGVEVDVGSGNVHDAEIRHGLSQLQYALPRLVTQYIEWNLGMLPEENVPFFFCPILLTTSEILVAADGLTMNDVEHADTLADFASPVPYVVVYADETPEFQRHRAQACASLLESVKDDGAMLIEYLREQAGVPRVHLPTSECRRLAINSGEKLTKYFSQIIVCSLANFESLLEDIKKAVSRTMRSKKVLELPKWES